MVEIGRLLENLEFYLEELKKFDLKAFKQADSLVKKTDALKEYDYNSDNLEYLFEIPLLEQQQYSFKAANKLKFIITAGNKGKDIVTKINKLIEDINGARKQSILSQYMKDEEKYNKIKCFIIRKLYIYYMKGLVDYLKEVPNDEIFILNYNVQKEIEEIQKDDNWFLANGIIKEAINMNINKVIENRKNDIVMYKDIKSEILEAIIDLEIQLDWIKIIVNLYLEESIRKTICEDEQFNVMSKKIDNILIELIDFYMGKDENLIDNYFNEEDLLRKILMKLGYLYSDISEGDILDLKLCQTLDIDKTAEIEKDFCISKVYKKGIIFNDSVIRKTLVNVYRFDPN
ncbi:MAG: hypothetical protein ABF633_07000 [Clostridium sp.]|uniref:hypothetical protein n=1 Tax=Clostridium sp. TaxID=1506 RepID=UPI0039E85EA6